MTTHTYMVENGSGDRISIRAANPDAAIGLRRSDLISAIRDRHGWSMAEANRFVRRYRLNPVRAVHASFCACLQRGVTVSDLYAEV